MRIVRHLSIAATLAGLLWAIVPAASAATFTVTRFDDPYPGPCRPASCTLREAVLASNSSPGPDTILAPAGDYTLILTGLDLPISDTLTIRGVGGQAVVDANGLQTGTRAFEIGPGVNATFEHVSARSGNPPADADGIVRGGAVRVDSGASLTMTDGIVRTSNAAGSSSQGGGIYTDGQLMLNGVTVEDNQSGSGGGIYVAAGGFAKADNSTLQNNSATSGGGIAGTGGALFTRSLLTGNSGAFGGAVETNSCGSFKFIYTTISGNYASQRGGAIYAEDAGIFLNNATVSSNDTNGAGGGVAVFYSPNGCATHVFLDSTILAGNADTMGSPDCRDLSAAGNLVSSIGHNVVGDQSGCAITPAPGDQIGSSGSPVDPKLMPLAPNGGPTETMALQPDSPAVEKGDRGSCEQTDQRGIAIGQDGDAGCDVGAYELEYAPSSSVAPSVSGKRSVGSILRCSTGVWAGARPMTFAYRWLRNGTQLTGTAQQHRIVSADRRRRLACIVTATNSVGTARAQSGSVAIQH